MSEQLIRWICPICTASCTFEAMEWCAKYRSDESDQCGFDDENPVALGGAFEFVERNKASIALEQSHIIAEQELLEEDNRV